MSKSWWYLHFFRGIDFLIEFALLKCIVWLWLFPVCVFRESKICLVLIVYLQGCLTYRLQVACIVIFVFLLFWYCYLCTIFWSSNICIELLLAILMFILLPKTVTSICFQAMLLNISLCGCFPLPTFTTTTCSIKYIGILVFDVSDLNIADLQISKSPIGPTKKSGEAL